MSKNQQWAQHITDAREELKSVLTTLTDEQWHMVVIGEGNDWTTCDIIAHLIENERGMSIHVHKIRNGRETVPAGFNLVEWNAGMKGRAPGLSPAELLAELDAGRERTLETLHSIKDDEWSLEGRHPSRGPITIEQYYETMAGHDRGHLQDIRQALGI